MTEEAKTIGARIRVVRGNASQGEFAKIIGTHPMTISKYERDQMSPAYDVLLRMIDRFSLSAQWLISGDGPMSSEAPPSSEEESGADAAMITHFDIEASAGGGSVVDSELIKGKIAFKRKWLEERELDERFLNVISVKGDSMEPTLSDGQLILVNRKDIRPQSGIYVINLGGDLLVKRVQRLFNGDLKIASDNPHYDPEVIPADQLDQVRIIGRVVWKGGLPL